MKSEVTGLGNRAEAYMQSAKEQVAAGIQRHNQAVDKYIVKPLKTQPVKLITNAALLSTLHPSLQAPTVLADQVPSQVQVPQGQAVKTEVVESKTESGSSDFVTIEINNQGRNFLEDVIFKGPLSINDYEQQHAGSHVKIPAGIMLSHQNLIFDNYSLHNELGDQQNWGKVPSFTIEAIAHKLNDYANKNRASYESKVEFPLVRIQFKFDEDHIKKTFYL